MDVDYRGDHAVAGCVVFAGWADGVAAAEHTVRVAPVAAYVPGQFYLRELPCVVEVLRLVRDPLEVVVIDGYVWLDGKGAPGLGARLFDALGGKVAVVGVAKTRFATAVAEEVRRPGSVKPLFVTAAGIEARVAAGLVAGMHGGHRVPTLLKRVDGLCRGG